MFSIVLPIKNHPEFLERFLSYYASTNLTEELFIADSSDSDHASDVGSIIRETAGDLKVRHRVFDADAMVVEKLSEVLDDVGTEFVVPAADDDFFAVDGLRQAVDLLRAEPDYSVAHGHAVIFEVEPGPVYGDRLLTSGYRQRRIQQESASERLLDHFTNYSTIWYSTHRTSNLRNNMKKLNGLQVDAFAYAELLASGLSVIQGKTGKVDVLYMMRQAHTQKREHLPDMFDWISNPDWATHYAHFETCLSEALVLQDSIPTDSARATVKQAFWKYLSSGLVGGWRSQYAPATQSVAGLKSNLAERAPGLLRGWQRTRALLPGEETQSLFPALLKSSSPYHQDFMPIYRAISRA